MFGMIKAFLLILWKLFLGCLTVTAVIIYGGLTIAIINYFRIERKKKREGKDIPYWDSD